MENKTNIKNNIIISETATLDLDSFDKDNKKIKKNRIKSEDLVGQIICDGNVLVLALSNRVNKYGSKYLKCKCLRFDQNGQPCGKLFEVRASDLNKSGIKKGGTKSCGCLNRKILSDHNKTYNRKYSDIKIGDKFGRLEVIEKSKNTSNGVLIWLCKCECESGIIKKVRSGHLKNGGVKSCGCIRNEAASKNMFNYHKLNPSSAKRIYPTKEESFKRQLYNDYSRYLEFDLSYEEACNIFTQSDYYTGEEPKWRENKSGGAYVNGIDAVSYKLGHVRGNMVPANMITNFMKGTLSQEEFYDILYNISNFNLIKFKEFAENKNSIAIFNVLSKINLIDNNSFSKKYSEAEREVYTTMYQAWIKKNQTEREHDVDLSVVTLDYYIEIKNKICHYCGAQPKIRKYMFREIDKITGKRKITYLGNGGIDRLDNNLGYVAGNMVPACWCCNKMKRDYTKEELLRTAFSVMCHHPEEFFKRFNPLLESQENNNVI